MKFKIGKKTPFSVVITHKEGKGQKRGGHGRDVFDVVHASPIAFLAALLRDRQLDKKMEGGIVGIVRRSPNGIRPPLATPEYVTRTTGFTLTEIKYSEGECSLALDFTGAMGTLAKNIVEDVYGPWTLEIIYDTEIPPGKAKVVGAIVYFELVCSGLPPLEL